MWDDSGDGEGGEEVVGRQWRRSEREGVQAVPFFTMSYVHLKCLITKTK